MATSFSGSNASLALAGLGLLVLPPTISGLQITHSNITPSLIGSYPIINAFMSTIFYLFLISIMAMSEHLEEQGRLHRAYLVFLILLYLLWTTLTYELNQQLWGLVVIVLEVIFLLAISGAIFRSGKPILSFLFIVALLWAVYLLIVQAILVSNQAKIGPAYNL